MQKFLTLLIGLTLCALAEARPTTLDTHKPEVKEFIKHMSEAYGFKQRPLKKLLGKAEIQQAILDAMEKPAEKQKLWFEYRPIFITERRISEGTDFWLAHRQELESASAQSGVAPEYIAAILGVETFYGRLKGHYKVLDALATLAFNYPPRSKFFRDELEQYLLLTREAHMDADGLLGSYAGALGAPQFMPSNYRKFGVDASADGRVDLWSNWADVCASVGNYLKAHGWISGGPVLAEAVAGADKPLELDGRKLALSETVGSLKSKGLAFDSTLPDDAPALLIAADEMDGIHWRIGYNNFYVITRYNHSPLYAMAVNDLAVAVKQRVAAADQASRAIAPVTPTDKSATR
jgi:membrane-bound lytic murein transglycosylase B